MRGLKVQLAALLLPLAALSAAGREKLGFDPATELDKAAAIYFAPESDILFRMRYPNGSYREFERNFERPDRLYGVNGWRGRIKGGNITLVSGDGIEGGRAKFVFRGGRLVSFEQGSFATNFPYGMVRAPAGDTPPYYFGEESSLAPKEKVRKSAPSRRLITNEVARELNRKWLHSSRLRWPFHNPNANGCLFGMLAIVATFLLGFRSVWIKAAGAVLTLVFAGAMVLSASRGAFLGFALALLPAVALNFRTLVKSKAAWILVGIALAAATAYFAAHPRLVTRGFRGASSWSNEVRLDMWKSAPQMMAEAPDGWHYHVGRANLDWYQSLDELSMPGSLINDHLTHMVAYGTAGRFLYLFAWLAGLSLLGLGAFATRNSVAFGTWILFGVATWFNPLFAFRWLWAVPLSALLLAIVTKPWKVVKARHALAAVVASAVLSAITIGCMMYAGSRSDIRGYPVHARDGRVYVKGDNPVVWLVDDSKALGGVLACKEIRNFYAANPEAPALGYVRDVRSLPSGIHRLVLAGDAGVDWLDMITASEKARANLPEEVLFISPPFPASALPPGLLEACSVRLVLGEFAARYYEEYDRPPEWVTVLPGMELYLNMWMNMLFESW